MKTKHNPPKTKWAKKAHKARQRRLNDWMPRFAVYTANMFSIFCR